MKTCIITIIKNEHLYLDEWITYHLNIGISHIFLYEDIDSESHKSITDKYFNEVTLNSILSLLSEKGKEKRIFAKKNNLGRGQILYFRKALDYIINTYDYDWCFLIDNDEFITADEPLCDILNLYRDYDAVLLSWKCYGANGIINLPDYSKKGVIETYKNPIIGYVPTKNDTGKKKTCFNLKKYKSEFWNTNHIPADLCNYCNTDFKKQTKGVCYTHMYLRHYITKSWEEYVWKKLSRGYFYGKARTLDNFFRINPEMKPLKEQLLSELDEETLVVLPYSQRGSQGSEIRITLSGWRKFCQSKYHFTVIGDFEESLPKEFPWVDFIKEPPVKHILNQYYPHLDIQHKMEVAYNLFKDKHKGFIYMVDDNYAIKPFNIYELKTIHYHQTTFVGRKDAPTNWWKHDKWKTRQLMDKEGFSHINYTTHFPCYFEFDRFKNLWDKFDMRNESYVPEDVYFNSYIHEYPVLDDRVRLGIWNTENTLQKIKEADEDPQIKFVCNSVEGWSKELEEALWQIINE